MYSINNWCGRFGNNIQQISNAIFFCKENSLNFQSPDNEIINTFSANFGQVPCNPGLYFFHIPSKIGSGIPDYVTGDIPLLYKFRREICKEYIYPNLKINLDNVKELDNDTVVMHIRSGDIFSRKDYYCPVVSNYIQNPLDYYIKISEKYNKVIVLTEDYQNPVIPELKKIEKFDIRILGIKETIEIMLSAKNIVTSGVSSFGISCALLSKNVKRVYVSNLVVDEILNLNDLIQTDIEVKVIFIDTERYIKWNNWLNSEDQRKLMIEYKI
jgi:hypothetical protein